MTHEEMSDLLVAFRRDVEFDMNEWYEKFSTLHARLTKRVKRAADAPTVVNGHDADPPPQRKSILHVRRSPWSI